MAAPTQREWISAGRDRVKWDCMLADAPAEDGPRCRQGRVVRCWNLQVCGTTAGDAGTSALVRHGISGPGESLVRAETYRKRLGLGAEQEAGVDILQRNRSGRRRRLHGMFVVIRPVISKAGGRCHAGDWATISSSSIRPPISGRWRVAERQDRPTRHRRQATLARYGAGPGRAERLTSGARGNRRDEGVQQRTNCPRLLRAWTTRRRFPRVHGQWPDHGVAVRGSRRLRLPGRAATACRAWRRLLA